MPKVLVKNLIFCAVLLSVVIKPRRISEWTLIYFVPASTIILIPSFNGLQNIGEAHVLSATVIILFFFAIFAIFGKSIISNVAVPGDSNKINLVLYLILLLKFFIFLVGWKYSILIP